VDNPTKNRLVGMAWLVLAWSSSACGELPTEGIPRRFSATHVGTELTYQISYHVMGIRLVRIGEARSFTVEGEWKTDEGSTIPAYYSEVRIRTLDNPENGKRGRISIRSRMVAVMSMPDLNTLVYFKDADEYFNPLFKDAKHDDYLDYYQVNENGIDYFREDHHTGERRSELRNAGDLMAQNDAIAASILRMSEIYRGRKDALTTESDFRVQFNVDGTVKPFAAESSRERCEVKPVGGKVDSLRVDIRLAPEAEGKAGKLTMWGMPFLELAERLGDRALIQLAGESPDYSMIPLLMKYDRPIGYIRCKLETIQVAAYPAERGATEPASSLRD
jgi:hypothetical protein